MDADRFDNVARALTGNLSRRGTLGLGLGGLLASLLGSADAEAKRGKNQNKNKKGKKGKGRNGPPPSPCADGFRNGSETDVDCGGGNCPRCAIDRSCFNRNDCAGALCSGGICTACTSNAQCGSDVNGTCFCFTPADGGPKGCAKNVGIGVANCADCAAGTTCVVLASGSLGCFKLCGAP